MLAPLLIVSLTVYHVYFVTRNFGELTSFIDHNLSVLITAVITMMGLSIAVLLLPSLTKIKVGSVVELETVTTIHTKSNGIELEAFSTIPSLISVSMPTEIPLQSFRMPLQSLRMPTKYPLKSTRMTLQSFNHL